MTTGSSYQGEETGVADFSPAEEIYFVLKIRPYIPIPSL